MKHEKKLTSIRLDADVLEEIERFLEKNRYWKRSDVINLVLRAVLENFSDWDILTMMRYWNWAQKKVDVKFEVTDFKREEKHESKGTE